MPADGGGLRELPAPSTGTALLKEEMGRWLSNLAPWDVFSTWTFSRPVRAEGAMYWGRRHIRKLDEMAGMGKGNTYAFVAAETGDVGGLVHLHALVGNVGHLKAYCEQPMRPGEWGHPCCMVHAWPCGYARVFTYDPKLGASFYVGKYITKAMAEWELVSFPTQAQKSFDPRAVKR